LTKYIRKAFKKVRIKKSFKICVPSKLQNYIDLRNQLIKNKENNEKYQPSGEGGAR